MKKLWLLLVALIPLCACDVCLFEDLEESSLQAGAKQGNKATMFSFPSVRENEGDWKVKIFRVIDFDNYNSWKVSVGDENAKPTIVSVYSANCEKCAKQAPYLDKLAQNFSPEDIDFVVIFLDFDKQTVANVPWLNELQHVKVAHNVISTCPSNNKGKCLDALEKLAEIPAAYAIGNGKVLDGIDAWSGWPDNEAEYGAAYDNMLHKANAFWQEYSLNQ